MPDLDPLVTLLAGDCLDRLPGLPLADICYCDPPYGTGRVDLGYDDALSSGPDWVAYMRPRFEAVRQRLAPLGVMFVSIDGEHLVEALTLLDEVWGGRQHHRLAAFTVDGAASGSSRWQSGAPEYLLAYGHRYRLRKAGLIFREPTPGAHTMLDRAATLRGSDEQRQKALQAWIRSLPPGAEIRRQGRGLTDYNQVIGGRVARFASLARPVPGGPRYDVEIVGRRFVAPHNGWRWTEQRMQREIAAGNVHVSPEGATLRQILWLDKQMSGPPPAVLRAQRGAGARALQADVPGPRLLHAKDPAFLARILRWVVGDRPDAVVLDPFAGSGSTAVAVDALNREDGGSRRTILIEERGDVRDVIEKRLSARGLPYSLGRPGPRGHPND